jgi:hypothetical protein
MGFGGQSPIMQTAGKVRYLTEEPTTLIERGEYMTDVNILFGANEGEGIMAFDIIYRGYIKPNNLFYNETFWKYDSVRAVLGALGLFLKIYIVYHFYSLQKLIIFINNILVHSSNK